MADDDQTEIAVEGADDGRPEWLEDRYSTPEDQAKAYTESRKEMDRLRSQLDEERSQFAAALERIEATQQPAQPQFEQQNPILAQWQNAVDQGDAAAQLAITLQLQQQQLAQALDERFKTLEPKLEAASTTDRDIAFRLAEGRVQAQYGEKWGEIGGDVDSWLKDHPAFLPSNNSPDAWETVIGEAARYVTNEKAAARLAALESDRAAKLSAQTSTGGASGRFSTVTDEKKQEWDSVKSAEIGSYGQVARS